MEPVEIRPQQRRRRKIRVKPWYKTRRFWVNAALVLGSLIAFFQTNPMFAEYAPILGVVSGVLNIILAAISKSTMGLRESETEGERPVWEVDSND